MNPKPNLLLFATSLLYFAAAIPLLFAPGETLALASSTPPSAVAIGGIQILGTAYLGFAMLNWMNRFSVIGGIHGRPLLVANFAHVGSATALLAHHLADGLTAPAFLTLLGIYTILAVGFGARLFGRTPVRE